MKKLMKCDNPTTVMVMVLEGRLKKPEGISPAKVRRMLRMEERIIIRFMSLAKNPARAGGMVHMLPYIKDISKSIINLDKLIKIFIIENSYHYQ